MIFSALNMTCGHSEARNERVRPVVVTETVQGDSDDPAIWLHPTDPMKSFILGTDKTGILFVFDLEPGRQNHKVRVWRWHAASQ